MNSVLMAMLITISYVLPISKIANDPELMKLAEDGKVCSPYWPSAEYIWHYAQQCVSVDMLAGAEPLCFGVPYSTFHAD